MGADPSQYVQYGRSADPTKRVFLTYTAAVSVGYPVCYDFDNVNTYQNEADTNIALTTAAQSRRICVEKPSRFNNNHFAGALARDYAANTAGQFVDIYPPGSICTIRLASAALADPTVTVLPSRNTGQLLTFGVDKWYFKKSGFPGSGSAMTLQTITGTAASVPTTAMAELQTGTQSGGYQELKVYSGTITLMISNNAFTRGGVTEILSAVDGSDGTKAAITTHYTLTDGDYIGQKKLFLIDTSTGYTVFELIICIPKATTYVTTGPQVAMITSILTRAAARILISSTKGEGSGNVIDCTWNGNAWMLAANADKIS